MQSNARPANQGTRQGARQGGAPSATEGRSNDPFARLSDIELVVGLTKPLLHRLSTEMHAEGLTLHERITSVENQLDVADIKRARFVSSVRNKLLNEMGADSLDDRAGFIRAAREVDNAITLAVNTRKQNVASKASNAVQRASEEKSKSGCFIATAVYGDCDHTQVIALRTFRDQHLLTTSWGRMVVAAYYRVSPPLADWLRHQPRLSAVIRRLLDKFVARLGDRFER